MCHYFIIFIRSFIFYKLKWLSFQQRQDFHKCILVYKCRMGLAPQYLCDMFIAKNSNHSYNTRNATQLRATITKTAYYYHRFTVSGLNLCNSLPNHIKECTFLSSFRKVSLQPHGDYTTVLMYFIILPILSVLIFVDMYINIF